MTTSVFDPFDAGACDTVDDWLAASYRRQQDRDVAEMLLPVEALIIRIPGGARFLTQLGPAWKTTQANRSTSRRIGLFRCDEAAMRNRRYAKAVLLRAALALSLSLLTAAGGLGGVTAAAVAVTVWTVGAWIAPLAWLAAVLSGLVVLLTGDRPAVEVGAVAFASVATLGLRRGTSLAEVGFQFYGSPSSDPLRFLGRWMLTRALWSRPIASLVLALDKTTHDDLGRARFFLEDCKAMASARWTAVIRQCEAVLESGDLRIRRALILCHEAAQLAADAPPGIQGWCALHFGDVLLAAGEAEAAEIEWQRAVTLLAQSRDRFWRVQAELRLAQALTRESGDVSRVVEGLQIVCRLRLLAVRSYDVGLLRRTEYLLLRLMYQAGNTEGVRWQLSQPALRIDPDKVFIGTSFGQHAMGLLLEASIMMSPIDASTTGPPDWNPTRAAELIGAALRHLARTRDPLLHATAYAELTRVQAASGRRRDALASVLESLQAIQRVRYQLPTSSWRASWVRSHRHVYSLALELARDDSALVAELLEVVRSQAVPLDRDEPGTWTRSVLNALIASFTLPGLPTAPDPAVGATPATDPLVTDQTILVQQASWLGGDRDVTIDLDTELDAMFPDAWYWSVARADSWIYHAIRTPDGTWVSERMPYGELDPALDELFRLLPVKLPQEADHEASMARVRGTALLAETADLVTADGRSASEIWSRTFDRLGEVLMPRVLRHGLMNGNQTSQLVIAPTGFLSAVPFAALSIIPGTPLIERAVLTYLPAIALLAARRHLTVHDAGAAHDNAPTSVLAVLGPHTEKRYPRPRDVDLDYDVDLPYALKADPPGARIHRGRMTKAEFAAVLKAEAADDAVLYLAGHVDGAATDDPAATGFRFRGSRLTLRDLYEVDDDKQPVYPVPRRVLLCGCASLGLYTEAGVEEDRPFAAEPEWLGLGAAMVFGGAEHVYCSLFLVVDSPYVLRIEESLIEALRHSIDPAHALRAVQRAEIRRWRDGEGSMPATFLAYVYVGIGTMK